MVTAYVRLSKVLAKLDIAMEVVQEAEEEQEWETSLDVSVTSMNDKAKTSVQYMFMALVSCDVQLYFSLLDPEVPL